MSPELKVLQRTMMTQTPVWRALEARLFATMRNL